MKTAEKIEKSINSFIKRPEFQAKYLKNIICDVAHSQSTVAKTESCSICAAGISKKELMKMRGYDHGYSFSQLYNKRHQKRDEHGNLFPKYFTNYICGECLRKIEDKLEFKFKKSFAP
jgi:hypothetical protein